MPRVHDLKSAFNAGELSPRLAARVDFAKHRSGLDTAENVTLLSEGGAMRRGGTRYIAAEKDSTVKGRLKSFEFSTTQAYVIELCDNAMRFFKNQGQISVPNTDGSITNGTFDADVTGWTDSSTGTGSISWNSTNSSMDLNSASGANKGIAEQQVTITTTSVIHVLRFRVRGISGDQIVVRVGSSSGASDYLADFTAGVGWHALAFTPTASPFYIQFDNEMDKTVEVDDVSLIDNAPMELGTPWPEADLYQVEGPQSADILYLFHQDYAPYKLERRGDTTWSLVEVPWLDGPYLPTNDTATTLTPAATSGLGVNVTASAVTGINDGQGFLSTDVGRAIRINNPASGQDWGWCEIVGVTSTTVVTVDVKWDFATANATDDWRLGSWSDTTGFPAVATFFQQRLVMGGTSSQPETFWLSQTADFEDMTPDSDPTTVGKFDGSIEDDDSFDYTLSANTVNAIRWMSAGEDTMTIGTTGGEWVPSSQGAGLTPTDIAVNRQTTHGCAQTQPVRVDNTVLFVQRAKRKVREFSFAFETNGYLAADMTRLSQHITRGGVVEMAFAEEPDSQVWAVRGDGQLLSMTFRRQEDVVGWGRHIIGGSFSGGDAVVESVTTIPGANGAGQVQDSTNRNEVWMIVKRTINGATVRYIEMLERDFETGDAQEDSYYADSIITYDGASTTSITGLDHLEGETVKVFADGAIRADATVASGAITLTTAASVVQIGLGYYHLIKTLKLEGGNPAGTAVGKTKRIYGVTFTVLNSHTLKYGPDATNLVSRDFREVSDPMDAAAPFFTGDRFEEFDGDWGPDARIVIKSDDPTPFTLLSLAPEINLNPLK